MTISSGNITDEIIQKYIEDQEGDPVEIGQFEIDSTLIPPQLKAEGCLVILRIWRLTNSIELAV